MASTSCPVCNSLLNSGIQAWHWECSQCGYEKADFEPAINETFAHEQIDEQSREKGLQSLRIANFTTLLRGVVENHPDSGSLLDVGCAHGWFLEAAEKVGFKVLGIEPDLNVYQSTSKRGLPVRQGFFPDVLSVNERFDVIVFNDVFEHIHDLSAVLTGCRDHLSPGGMLVLNMPSSSGIFYRVARLLSRVGMHSFFERLWQKGLPSPHLHYFNPKNLRLLLQSNGFEEFAVGQLSTVRIKGLFTRVSYTGKHCLLVRLFICLLVSLAMPFIRAMPSDIIYSLSRKNFSL